jgi:hypothetical protein
MGLPQLIAATKNVDPAYFGGSVGLAAVLCIEDFLNVLAQNPIILATFKSFLQTLITFINLQVETLQLFVDTLLLQIDIITPIIQEYLVIKTQLASELSQFGISKFTACPPILYIQNAMTSQASGTSLLGKAFQGVRSMDAYITRLQLKVIKLKNQISRINAYIAELKATTIIFQAIINAINAQYPGV